jgi:hypothetical protein
MMVAAVVRGVLLLLVQYLQGEVQSALQQHCHLLLLLLQRRLHSSSSWLSSPGRLCCTCCSCNHPFDQCFKIISSAIPCYSWCPCMHHNLRPRLAFVLKPQHTKLTATPRCRLAVLTTCCLLCAAAF